MKKNLKRNFKRWIAFVLAVVIIMTTCVYSSDAYLRATDNPEQTEAVQEPTVVTDTIVPEDIPEEVIEEETDEPEEEEEIQQETPEEEIEDTSDDDEPEEPEPIPNDETEENEEKPADTPEASPEENPEETPEESPEASPIETPEGEPTPIPSPEATATPSATPTASPEREETYGYAVYYYFDGVEDKSVRVEKEDGVLGEVILTSVESAAVHNGMNYVLDYVENENGKVSDNPDNNIVRIYYVLAEEDAKVYTVVLEHILSTDNLGTFRSEETIRLTDKDLADGSVNLIDRAYSREGMECVTGEVVLSKDDFDSEYQAFARIDYGVADGWVAVLRGSGSAPASGSPRRARAVYVGKIDDVEFVKAGQIPVSISFVYEDGSIALDSETVMVEEENGEYNFTHSFKGIAGYTAELDEATPDEYNISGSADTGYQITAKLEFSEDTASGDSVGVVFKAGEGEYTVVTRVPTKGNKSVTDDPATYTETSETFTDKKVGELTEVEAKAITGFTPKAVKQQTVTGDGTTEVIVEYVRNNYTVTYDTQGGSYVKAEKWLYEDEAKVYDGESGKPGSDEVRKLICGKEEHTHDIWNGCYEWTGRNWNLTCTKEEHTHSSSCYFVSPAVPPTSSTFAPAPTRQGYTFTGWYKDAECTIPAEKTIASIDSDVTVYAGWEKKEVSYTVLYFIENANDTDYSFLSSEIKTGYAGNTVTVTAETASPSGLDTKNFTFKKATSAAIAADGSTVIKAYYSRNVYTLTSNKSFRINGKDQKLSLSAKYGANITEIMNREWNEPTGNKYAWTLTNSDSNKVAVFDTMPSGGGTVYSYEYQATREQTLSYWLENYNGSEQIKFDERTYGLYKEITVKFNYLTYSADFYEFPDYTKYKAMHGSKQLWGNNKGNVTTSNGMKVDFYYNANDVSLELFGYEGERISFNQVAIGADISSYLTEPTAPVDGAGFKGWYTDPAHTEKYTGGKKMPTSGLILYADWDMPKYEVTFMDGSETYKVQEVEYLKKVEEVEIMHEGFDFLGWYADSDYKEEFDFSQPITKDITVYAKWDEKLDTSCLIRHIVKDGDSEIDIVEPKEVVGMIGDTVSVRAISLSGDYRDYVADANEKSIVLSTKSKNEITFVYSPLNAIRYRVEYVYNGDIKAEQKDIEAEAKSFRVYPDKEIGTKLNKEGYKIKEGYAQANLTSDNSKNVVRFELAPNEYDITYAGIDDDTNTPVTITVPDANPKKYTVVSEDIPLMWPSFDTEEYNFEGWTTNGTVNGESQENTLVKDIVIGKGSIGRLTFTAHFTRKPVTLSYDGNGHTGGKTDATKGKVGKPITIAQNGFEKTGYTFVGWNTQADGQGTSYSAGQEVTIRKPLTLYAQWEANKNVSYTVHYYLKDTTTKVADDKVEQNKTFDAEYSENAKVIPGYTVVGDGQQSFTLDSLDKEIIFYYTADDAEITFVTNGGSAVAPMEGKTGQEIASREMPTTTRTGYTFNGWYNNAGLTGEKVGSLPEKYPAGTTTYYAAWKANENVSYIVHYYLQGTTDSVAADKTEVNKTFGGSYTEYSKRVTGYTVVGDGQQSFTLDSLNKEITFYYTADAAQITFATNGGSAVDDMEGVTGQEITNRAMPTTARTGYTFNGWYDSAELTGEPVGSLPEKYPAGTTTYYASWTVKTDVSYTVHYYLEDTTTSVAEDKVEQNKTFDAEYTESAVVVTGYTAAEPATQSFTLDSLNKEITFYYTADAAHITFVTNGGSAVEAMEGATGQEITNRAMPTTARTGYTFNGWYGSAELTGEPVGSLPEKYPAGTTTYYAAWSANTDTVYTVQYHYQSPSDGVYSDEEPVEKKGTTDTSVSLPGTALIPDTTIHKLESGRYIYDTSDNRNVISGNVEGDGSLALHVYFPIQYTVSGTIDHGTVTEASQDVRYAAASSAMSFKAGENYVIKSIKINGEEQEVEDNQIEYIYPAQTAVRSDIAVEITTEEMNPQLTLVKTVPEGPADKVAYVLGETINYKIVATNTGNLTLTGITVKDEMVGKEWEIEGDFKPGDTWERTVSYKVDEDDIKAGKVVNSVTAEVSDLEPDYPEPEVIPGEVESPVATPNPSLYVQKTALGNDDPNKTYARDEVVTYTIKVINNGNVTIKGIQLTDPLTGLEWNVGTLVPGDSAIPLLRKPSKERTTRYTVTSADILAGEVVNTATASGTDPDGNMVTATGTETIRMAAIDTSYSITKELTSDARADGTYHAGDTLSYRITVKSDANVTLENIVVTDTLSNNVTGAVNFTKLKGISANDAGALAQAGITLNPDNTVKIGSLEPDEEVVLECEYVVTSADAALNTQLGITDSENAGIRNTVRATADTVNPPGKDPVDPEEETGESDPAETEDTYTLTIQYQYADGTMAADAVTRYYPVGETYVVASPVIAGYNSSLAAVTGVMPDRDVNVTVVYSIPTPPTPPTPDEPEPTPPISPEPPTPPTPDEPEPPAPPVPPTPEEPEPPVEPIVEPAAPVVPGPAAAAAVQVVIPAALTAVGDEEVPLEGALIDVDDDGNVTVIPIEEEEIPLDNRELDDHKCCILSFLLMLATLIIYSWFTHSMKKRQKKLAELKDQLAEETLKRQLGIADTKESAR